MSSKSNKCLVAPSCNPSLAYFNSNKYSIGVPMHSISFMFDYIIASTFCVVAGMNMLPMHISTYSTLCYTKQQGALLWYKPYRV